jgi:GT2 family glycosyltransferase
MNIFLSNWLSQEGSDCCAILAHDIITKPGCLRRILNVMNSDPSIGIVSPEYGNRELAIFSPVQGPRLAKVPGSPTSSFVATDYAHGALMVMRRACLEQVGLFDERFFAYGDEVDICLRARQAKWKVGVVIGAVVDNPITEASNDTISYLWTRNTLLLAQKYGGSVAALCRTALAILNSAKIGFQEFLGQTVKYKARPRLLGVQHFIQHCFGPPPEMK